MLPSKEIDTISQTKEHLLKWKKYEEKLLQSLFKLTKSQKKSQMVQQEQFKLEKQLKSVMGILHAMCLVFKKEQLIWKQAVQMRF